MRGGKERSRDKGLKVRRGMERTLQIKFYFSYGRVWKERSRDKGVKVRRGMETTLQFTFHTVLGLSLGKRGAEIKG